MMNQSIGEGPVGSSSAPEEWRWERAPGVVSRRVAGEMVLVPVDVSGAEPGSFFVLNASGELLWELLREPCDVEQMARYLMGTYAIDHDTARHDATRFVERLVGYGALRVHEGK